MFCRIYITRKPILRQELLISISNLYRSELVRNLYIERDGFSLDVTKNDEYDENKSKIFPDGFLYFPFSIEIDFSDEISEESAAKDVGELLEFLWKNNYTAIASCDFEEILPESGGYRSRNIPWFK